MFPGPLGFSLCGKALEKKLFQIATINIRDFAKNKAKTVDDNPFGGGAGMILRPDILQESLEFTKKKVKKINTTIYLSPGGKKLDHKVAKSLTKFDEIIIICGKYEGIDNRFLNYNSINEISVGDYVLSGGEIASFTLIDTCVRLLPKVLGNKNSLSSESFHNNLLEYPQYTKPFKWREICVPEILRSGNHQKISDWRLKKSIEKTKKVRPDLFELYLKKNKGDL
jgi:tRNA (guanine37-N1)-methyltransferase